jgi:hypothetical protein
MLVKLAWMGAVELGDGMGQSRDYPHGVVQRGEIDNIFR